MDFPLLARACIRIWFPEKSIHPFTRRMFSVDFHRFSVWRLAFPSVHTGRKMTVKGWFRKPSQSKTVENQEGSSIIALIAVNTWKSKPSHLKRLKIKKKEPLCERVNAFLRVKIKAAPFIQDEAEPPTSWPQAIIHYTLYIIHWNFCCTFASHSSVLWLWETDGRGTTFISL